MARCPAAASAGTISANEYIDAAQPCTRSTGGVAAAPQRARVVEEPDRRRAIAQAIQMAGPGDLVLIAGKGHENYQIFAERTIHFDDREVAREVLGAGV